MLIKTEELKQSGLDLEVNLQTYCGLDCCVTGEVLDTLRQQYGQPPDIYSFERALQGPYLEIMRRGFKVDELSRRQAAESLHKRLDLLHEQLNEFAVAMWQKPLNPRSPAQLKDFFYNAMKLPEQTIRQKGQTKVSTNRESLEKLDDYLFARPFTQHILRIRDLSKQLDVFETQVDPDGRLRTSYNIAGTETGRPSSSENAYGTGGNMQNIAEPLRYVFVADQGYKLGVVDLEQAEARDFGWLCGVLFDKWKFLDNCESGDLHTSNSKLVWPQLGWTGDKKKDREIAEQIYYRDYTYRYMAKRLGHLTDYMGTPWTSARVLKIPLEIAEDFAHRYVLGENAAYPEIPQYWQWVAEKIQTEGCLTTAFGRTRHFFSRPDDDTTLREAIAFVPQSMTADRMSLGMWRVWYYMPEVQLLANGYDSITFQYREEDEDRVIPKVLSLCSVPLTSPNGRIFSIPCEAKVGWNWGSRISQADVEKELKKSGKKLRFNPDGLVKWNPKMKDTRVRTPTEKRIMT